MPPAARKRRLSDAAYRASGSIRKRFRHRSPSPLPNEVQEQELSDLELSPLEIPVSSAPATPQFDGDDDNTPIPPLNLSPVPSIVPVTPSRAQPNQNPETPMSLILNSPLQLRGRPRIRRPHHNPLADSDLRMSPIRWEDRQVGMEMKRAAAEASQELDAKALEREETDRAQKLFHSITSSRDNGGFGFRSMNHFADRLFGTGSLPQMKANVTRWCKGQGSDLASAIFNRSPDAFQKFLGSSQFRALLQKEGEAIQKLLSRSPRVSMRELLAEFSMTDLSRDVKEAAPILWEVLTSISSREGKSQHDENLVCSITGYD
ncbi:hypothetical protein EV360DRAFT_57078 [Lentinula raphanica]|nr:hypothetical protein EV360DRAFT_57078 [Lentinula raphanica]